MCGFKVGDIVVSKNVRVEVWEFYEKDPDTFGGVNVLDGDVSGLWLKSHFKKELE